MSHKLLVPAIAGALLATTAPFLSAAPAAADPAVAGLGCLAGATQTLTSSGGAVAVPDLSTVTKTITVPDGGTLSWLRLQTDVTSVRSGDLLMTLTSPAGKVLTLTSGNGGSIADAFNGTWWADDAGATNAPGSAVETNYTGPQSTLAPEEGLGALRGQSVQGDWVLSVADQAIGGGANSLADWTLQYATQANGAPDLTNLGSGLLPGGTVPAGTTHDFTYLVTGSPLGSVQDVVAKLDTNAASSAVKAVLISPAGTPVTLVNALPSAFPFLTPYLGGITLGDYAGLLAGSGPVGDLVNALFFGGGLNLATPEEPLSALTGQGLAGLWTLRLSAIGAPVVLNSWGLDLTGSSCGLDSVLTPLSTLPSSIPMGTTFAYAVSAANARLASLTGNSLGLTLPSGVQLVGVTSTLGSCTGPTCALGTLLGGDQGVVVFLIKGVGEGAKNLTLTLSHLGLDASPLNNILNLSTVVTPPTPTTTGKDTTAPSVLVLLGKDKLRTVAAKGLMAALGGTEAGRLTLKVKIPGKVAKRLHLSTLVGKRTITMTKAATMKTRLKLTKKAARKLAGSKLPVRLIVKATLRDASGNVGRASASGVYKR